MTKQLMWLLSLSLVLILGGCANQPSVLVEAEISSQNDTELSTENAESSLGSLKEKQSTNTDFENISDYIKDNEQELNNEEILYDFGNSPLANLESANIMNKRDTIEVDNLVTYSEIDTHCTLYKAKLSPDKNKLYIEYTGDNKDGIITISKDKDTIVYKIDNAELIALVLGNGEYTVKLYTTKNGVNCSFKEKFTVNVENSVADSAYKGQSYYSNYKIDDTEFVEIANSLWEQSSNINEYIWNCYIYTSKYPYDYEKSTSIIDGKILRYRPDVEELVEEEKGICLDKSAVLASLLRAKDIPTKIVFGYYKDMYHAWVDVSIANQWLMFDPTLKIDYSSSEVSNYNVSRYN